MASVNKVILIGNLGADPEIRYTSGGTPVANFNLATKDTWTNKDGVKEDRTEWHRIVAWGRLGQICGEYLVKGKLVYIEGKLRTRTWEDREGNKRYTTEILAQNMQMLSPGGERTSTERDVGGKDLDLGEPPGGGPFPEDDIPF